MKKKLIHLFEFRGIISIVFYISLFILLWYLIIPHTSMYYRNDFFNPFMQRLNEEDVTLVVGEEFKLYIMSVNKRVSYSSSDFKVAGVNFLGKVVAYRCGTAIIKVKVDGDVLKCRVRVIDINKNKLNMKVGTSKELNIKGAWFENWKSSEPTVAKVSRFGKVTAISKGNAIIYGKVRGKTVECKVKIYE